MPSMPSPSSVSSKKNATSTKGKKKLVPKVPKCSKKQQSGKASTIKIVSPPTPTNFDVTETSSLPPKTGNSIPLVGVVKEDGTEIWEEKKIFVFNAKAPWCFTWFNFDESELIAICAILETVSQYIFQIEKTKKGTPHLQGYIYFNNKDRPDRYLSAFKAFDTVHWEAVTRGSFKHNVAYCSKLRSRLYPDRPPYTNIAIAEPILIEPLCLSWHSAMDGILSEKLAHRRISYWWWSKEGSLLKTLLCRYMAWQYPDTFMLVAGNAKDVKCQILERMGNGGLFPKIIFINLPKCFNPNDFCYDSLEELKDAFFSGSKYKGGMMPPQNRPHVVVFANFPPDENAMTKNRFRTHHLDFLSQSIVSGEYENIKENLRSTLISPDFFNISRFF